MLMRGSSSYSSVPPPPAVPTLAPASPEPGPGSAARSGADGQDGEPKGHLHHDARRAHPAAAAEAQGARPGRLHPPAVAEQQRAHERPGPVPPPPRRPAAAAVDGLELRAAGHHGEAALAQDRPPATATATVDDDDDAPEEGFEVDVVLGAGAGRGYLEARADQSALGVGEIRHLPCLVGAARHGEDGPAREARG
ncbi:hypothetical protein N3K66_008807 [Trichothecium roseum]|uniref:Uncharacterized protein n=1 Tax=Trichothecium roseum TaxID=47278 RepID=A0ACC0URF2_9HYPO|nr:hypothetical protein N3K66_008807 [Trichothecium roseum]